MFLKGGILEAVWFGKPALYDHLRIFGCDAFVHIRPKSRSKLDAKSMKGILMGYKDEGEMGYRISLPQLKKVIRGRDVVFNEASLLKMIVPVSVTIKESNFSMYSQKLNLI